MRKPANVGWKERGGFSAAHLSKVGWMVAVLIARNLMPTLNAVCPIATRKNRKK